MSASERLRALDGAATNAPWYPGHIGGSPNAGAQSLVADTGNICGMWDGGQTFDSLMANRDLIATLRNVLPLIADCIEQQERLIFDNGTRSRQQMWRDSEAALLRLQEALDALREHLEGDDE